MPSGWVCQPDNSRYADLETKLEMVVHAEENAILGAGERTRGGSIYVFGKPVCARCAGSLIQSGIKKIVAERPEPEKADESKWAKSGRIACQMIEEARIEFVSHSN